MNRIILASQSPRRKQLLEWAEIPFEVIISNTDESFPGGMNFEEAAIHIAREKAIAVSDLSGSNIPVLAADTIVICDDQLLGKPVDDADALRMLKMLSGNTHTVITGVVIYSPGKEVSFADSTIVEFNELDENELRHYISVYKPFDKAGAYAIQEWIGVVGIKKISGDFYNVMGLPVNRVVKALRDWHND